MEKICQSCGMPMHTTDLMGIDANGYKNEDYCIYCYEEGEFIQDCTMEEMIEHCADFVDEFNKEKAEPITRDQAIALMEAQFPTLKRWR